MTQRVKQPHRRTDDGAQCERTSSGPPSSARDGDTATRPPLTERIQAKLAKAADEHRANAQPDVAPTPSGRPPPKGKAARAAPGCG